MTVDDKNRVREAVRQAYADIAKNPAGPGNSCGCGCGPAASSLAKELGYTEEELSTAPAGANLSLGCGNPTAIAQLKEGETVLDLGSGAGFDCFLAAAKVGPSGKIIGVDMTPEMIEKARANAGGYTNVEFRLGNIEALPVASDSVDVVISNCVINLSPDKKQVFEELKRVLRPGGRIAISDIALYRELPDAIRQSLEAYVGCVAGASLIDDYRVLVEQSGLKNVKVEARDVSACIDSETLDPAARSVMDVLGEGGVGSLAGSVASVYVTADK